MTPPARFIRSYSIGDYGLWSFDKSMALPLRHNEERESPAFAAMYVLGVISKTFAVQPTELPIN